MITKISFIKKMKSHADQAANVSISNNSSFIVTAGNHDTKGKFCLKHIRMRILGLRREMDRFIRSLDYVRDVGLEREAPVCSDCCMVAHEAGFVEEKPNAYPEENVELLGSGPISLGPEPKESGFSLRVQAGPISLGPAHPNLLVSTRRCSRVLSAYCYRTRASSKCRGHRRPCLWGWRVALMSRRHRDGSRRPRYCWFSCASLFAEGGR